nr:MAG TPA: hypothetical protein [Caudoviricetes sp.]
MPEHSFDIDLAQEFGVNAAILFKNICFWIDKNRANGTNIFDGDCWTYNSKRAFSELFPYMSERQVGSALQKLIDARMIKTGNYNEDKRDKTTWYALDINGVCMVQKCKTHLTKSYNGNCENVRPLPYNKHTDINTDINTDITYNPPAAREDYMYADAYPQAEPQKVERQKNDYKAIADLYNSICVSLPKVTAMSDNRQKAIAARLKTYTVDQFREMFAKAENSAFLKGSNNRNWTANFDWLVKDANFAKVLDGNYDNTIGTVATGNQTSKTTPCKTTTSKTTQEFETNSFDVDELYNMALQKSYKELGLS